ncbi:MAG: maleylpyruvate isomerase N-terminal domain-containing protein [Acidimicrobiales bacterium]
MLMTPAESAFAYAGIRQRLTELLEHTSDDEASSVAIPACPDWTITDVVAHLYGVGVDIMDGNIEAAGTAAWADDQVRRFAPLGLRQLSEVWNETSPRVEAMGGTFPPQVASQLVFDACTHEHDLRGAIACPGARDTDSVVIGLTCIEDSIRGLVEDRQLPGIELDSPHFEATIGPTPAPVRVSTSAFELFRSFAGRRSTDQIRALPWQGDPSPYLEVFDRGPFQPPSRPLIE